MRRDANEASERTKEDRLFQCLSDRYVDHAMEINRNDHIPIESDNEKRLKKEKERFKVIARPDMPNHRQVI